MDIYLSKVAQSFKSIMRIDSRVPAIHDIAISIYLKCRKLNILLIVEWRSRDNPAIQLADEGSPCCNESGYGLDFDLFLCLVEICGHLSLEVDCMVQASNKRCGRYFSWFPDCEAEGRNFFSQTLDSTTTYN